SFAPCIPLAPTSTQSELETFFRDLKVRALVTTAEEKKALAAAEACGITVVVISAGASRIAGQFEITSPRDTASNAAPVIAWARPEDVATVLLTSGTTSASGKVIPLTHSQLL